MNPSMSNLYIKCNLYCSYLFSISPTYILAPIGDNHNPIVYRHQLGSFSNRNVRGLLPHDSDTWQDEYWCFLILVTHHWLVSCVKIVVFICFNIWENQKLFLGETFSHHLLTQNTDIFFKLTIHCRLVHF